MTTYKMALSADKKTVYIGKDTVAFPAQSIALPNFDHNESDDPVHAYAGNHTLFHHVRETLYKRKAADGTAGASYPAGIYNMQELSIVRHGAAINATWLSAAALEVVAAATAPIVIKYRTEDPEDTGTNATNTDFTFVSSDPTKATVSAAGVVTGVAAGEAIITATEKNGTKSVEIAVEVTAE